MRAFWLSCVARVFSTWAIHPIDDKLTRHGTRLTNKLLVGCWLLPRARPAPAIELSKKS
jgi:hypothetical protein